MKLKEKILLISSIIVLILFIISPMKSNAALQANGSGTSTKKKFEEWITQIRTMEQTGGTLGLTEGTLKDDLTVDVTKGGKPNNLDIHMQKNTEYGAMAILSASNYGKSTPVYDTSDGKLTTTTGNKSGVFMNLTREWVSAGTISNSTIYKNASGKYKNIYTNAGLEKRAGDATLETSGWHSIPNTYNKYIWFGENTVCGAFRGQGTIFSYEAASNGNDGGSYYTYSETSRAVIVIGNGF